MRFVINIMQQDRGAQCVALILPRVDFCKSVISAGDVWLMCGGLLMDLIR